ncbi:MAG: chemotaxis protein CheW [Syntrophomonadaceae bacterium]
MVSVNLDSDFSGQQNLPYVICGVKKQLIGISCQYVRELVILPQVTQLPDMSSSVRGVFNNRGTIVPVVDLRSKLSLESAKNELEDLVSLLHQREQDHKNWIEELYNSTVENRPFKLTTDPHKCAFGKWYDSFSTANYILSLQLEKFDEPHKMIHSFAHTVEKLKLENKFDEAFKVIEDARNTKLKELVNLFEETRQLLQRTHREMAVITEIRGKSSAIAVDRVESVEPIAEERMENPPSDFISQENNLIAKIGRRSASDQFVYILDPKQL